jgi:membrane-bound lytic murein transglycosylase A
MQKKSWFFFLLISCLVSCTRAPVKNAEEAMRLSSNPPEVLDSLSSESFFTALGKHVAVMKTSSLVSNPMVFGKKTVAKDDYIKSLEEIFNHQDNWQEWIATHFDFYEVYGREHWSEIMSTGYYEPQVSGSHVQTPEFSQALYSTPNDLITIDLKSFSAKFTKGERLNVLQGRMVNQNFVPYYSRKEIDEKNILKDKKLELAWVDPIDAFFIQIQGSGVIEFSDGEKMRVGYDNQNGHTYYPIGRSLWDVIPVEKMSMRKIKNHLQTLSKSEQQKVFNRNPSYVFFKKLDTDAMTYAGMEVQDGRTIATDAHLFPKGALAFLDIDEPEFKSQEDEEPESWQRKPRFVFDQDTGGAIRGADRVDLYFGRGPEAAQKAGVMKQKGKLYYLVPRN